jgi:hypothetical protein
LIGVKDCVQVKEKGAAGVVQAAVSSGDGRRARFAAVFGKRETSEKAPERGEGDRRERGSYGSLTATNFAGDARRRAEIRREISRRTRDGFEERQRGKEGGGVGVFIEVLAWGRG